MAFNAKNLTYTNTEPAFLQRLKANHASQDGRNNVQHARPGKSRLKMGDGDEDDGPVILDESGEVVRKDVYEGMLKGEKIDAEDSEKGSDAITEPRVDGEREEKQQRVVEVGGGAKKRKAGRVVVGDDPDSEGEGSAKVRSDRDGDGKKLLVEKSTPAPKKKKAKKIKLSFDEPE